MKTYFGSFRALNALIILNTISQNKAAVPQLFPASGKALWFRSPGIVWAEDYLPVGNGYLAGKYIIQLAFI